MEDRIHVLVLQVLQQAAHFPGRPGNQVDSAPLRLRIYVRHHRQPPVGARADEQPAVVPGDILTDGKGGVAELAAEDLGSCFLSLAHPAALDYHVAIVLPALYFDLPEANES